jgi:hypothetical protein
MSFQILRGALKEDSKTEMRAKHANSGATLKVDDIIEYLANTQLISDWDFNWVRSSQRVKLEGCLNIISLRTCQPCSQAVNTSWLFTYDKLC